MTDTKLRALERTHAAQDTPETHAALLRGRVRAGELPALVADVALRDRPELGLPCSEAEALCRVELAAYVDHKGAWAALSWPLTPDAKWPHLGDPTRYEGLSSWDSLQALPQALPRAAIAAARAAVELYERTPENPSARQAWESARRALACPCEAHRRACVRAVRDALSELNAGLGRLATLTAQASSYQFVLSIRLAAELAGEEAVRQAIRDDVSAWALGERDPVREDPWLPWRRDPTWGVVVWVPLESRYNGSPVELPTVVDKEPKPDAWDEALYDREPWAWVPPAPPRITFNEVGLTERELEVLRAAPSVVPAEFLADATLPRRPAPARPGRRSRQSPAEPCSPAASALFPARP